MRLIPLLLRVPPEERAQVPDLLRAICPTRDYVREREDCLRRMGIVSRSGHG
jgi:hypothetical protein